MGGVHPTHEALAVAEEKTPMREGVDRRGDENDEGKVRTMNAEKFINLLQRLELKRNLKCKLELCKDCEARGRCREHQYLKNFIERT